MTDIPALVAAMSVEGSMTRSGDTPDIERMRELLRDGAAALAASQAREQAAVAAALREVSVADAAVIVAKWLHVEVVTDSCHPVENREPGCLSCDALHVFELLADALEDPRILSALKAPKGDRP